MKPTKKRIPRAKKPTTPGSEVRRRPGSSRAAESGSSEYLRTRRDGSEAHARRMVYVLSDSTGNLPRHILTALLTQFPPQSIAVQFENFTRTEQQVDQVLERAAAHAGVVCHAIVSPALKQRVAERSKAASIPSYDLTGGIVEFLTKTTGVQPRCDTDALHRLDEAYRRRIGAMEFTLSHDDGL